MPIRPTRLAPAALTLAALAFAACTPGTASPSAASPSASPSASVDASASPSASADASASADTSASPSTGGTEIAVTAVDFRFEGLPTEVQSGATLTLTNEGQEVHEIVVVRKLPTTTQSFEELLALPQEEAQALVEDIGFAFAEPGQTATETVTIGDPGEYLAICFIPAGTTSLPSIDPNSSAPPSMGTGAPHFTLGMLQEFTVTQ